MLALIIVQFYLITVIWSFYLVKEDRRSYTSKWTYNDSFVAFLHTLALGWFLVPLLLSEKWCVFWEDFKEEVGKGFSALFKKEVK